MATNRGRKQEDQDGLIGQHDGLQAVGADIIEREQSETEPANADESRAVEDPAPSWAEEPDAPEVMTSRDQRRAGVLESLRHNAGHGTSLERRADGGGVVVVGPAGAWLESTLRSEMTTDGNAAAHATEEIIGRVMAATTLEDLLSEDNTVDAKDIIGVKLQIWGYKVNESEFQQGMPGYMLISAIRQDTKEDLLITCGAYKVQAQMLRAKTLGFFPFLAHFTASQTRAGNTTYGLALDKE